MLFDVHEVYDIASGEWSCLEPMAIPRHGVAAVSLDDRVLLPGGGIVQGLLPTSAVDSFVPPVEVPALAPVARSMLLPGLLLIAWVSVQAARTGRR